MITCISRGLYTCQCINCCKVNHVQTFRTILQRYLYFISTVHNTVTQYVSLAQHIIGGPVRHIMRITFASGSLLRRDHFCGRTSPIRIAHSLTILFLVDSLKASFGRHQAPFRFTECQPVQVIENIPNIESNDNTFQSEIN